MCDGGGGGGEWQFLKGGREETSLKVVFEQRSERRERMT